MPITDHQAGDLYNAIQEYAFLTTKGIATDPRGPGFEPTVKLGVPKDGVFSLNTNDAEKFPALYALKSDLANFGFPVEFTQEGLQKSLLCYYDPKTFQASMDALQAEIVERKQPKTTNLSGPFTAEPLQKNLKQR